MLKFTSIVGYTSCGPTYIESFLTIFGQCINVLNYNILYYPLVLYVLISYIPQVQEQFQQQLHEQQQKLHLLQALVEKQKEQIERKEEPELPNIPLEQIDQENMSHDAIKMAFSKLQV